MLLFPYILALHIAAGCVVIVIGVAPMLTRKGSRAHRMSGRIFSIAMAVVLVAAWAMTLLKPDLYLLGLSAAATLTLFSGLRVLGRKRPDIRHDDQARPLDWIVTLCVIGAGLAPISLTLAGFGDTPPAIAAALAYGVLSIGLWDIWRFLRPADWPFSPDLWMYEHLWKMIGAYSAALSAFAGNFLTVIPAPWSALWPTILFQSVTLAWIIRLVWRRRRSDRVPA